MNIKRRQPSRRWWAWVVATCRRDWNSQRLAYQHRANKTDVRAQCWRRLTGRHQ